MPDCFFSLSQRSAEADTKRSSAPRNPLLQSPPHLLPLQSLHPSLHFLPLLLDSLPLATHHRARAWTAKGTPTWLALLLLLLLRLLNLHVRRPRRFLQFKTRRPPFRLRLIISPRRHLHLSTNPPSRTAPAATRRKHHTRVSTTRPRLSLPSTRPLSTRTRLTRRTEDSMFLRRRSTTRTRRGR